MKSENVQKLKNKLWILLATLIFLPAGTIFAQFGNSDTFQNQLRFSNLRDFLEEILNVIIAIAFPIIVLAIIYTGFLFVSARGNDKKLITAKHALVWTLVGAMILLGAFVLSRAIKETVDDIKRADTNSSQMLVVR